MPVQALSYACVREVVIHVMVIGLSGVQLRRASRFKLAECVARG